MHQVTVIEPKWLSEVAPTFFRVADQNKISKRKASEKIEPLFDRFAADKDDWVSFLSPATLTIVAVEQAEAGYQIVADFWMSRLWTHVVSSMNCISVDGNGEGSIRDPFKAFRVPVTKRGKLRNYQSAVSFCILCTTSITRFTAIFSRCWGVDHVSKRGE